MGSRTAAPGEALLADGVMLAATLVWGTTFVVVRDALADLPPFLFVALRFSLATLLLAPIALRVHGLPDRPTLKAGATVGLWLFLGYLFQTWGMVETPPARAAFITGLSVVLVPVLLVLVYRRVPPAGSMVGVALATAGLALLTGAWAGGFIRGDLLVLAGAVGFALQLLAVDRYTRSVGPTRLLFVELATVAVLAWPAALLFEEMPSKVGIAGWRGVIITAVLATLGAFWAQNWSQQRTPPTRAAVILTLEPVFAAAFSYLMIGERFGLAGYAGSALIVAGMLAAEIAPLSRGRSAPLARGPRQW